MSATSVQPDRYVVLCVEDDLNEQRLVQAILETNGFDVLHARTAAAGLRLFREHPVTLVIIDQRLGRKQMTGAQLARKIKAMNRNVPVVLRSGFPPPTMEKTWDVFINKGEDVERFLAIIQDLLRRFAA